MSLDHVAAFLRLDAPKPFVADQPFRGIQKSVYSPANHGGDTAVTTQLSADTWTQCGETWHVARLVPTADRPTFFEVDHNLCMHVDSIRNLVKRLLFVIFCLDRITSDPAILRRIITNEHFLSTFAVVVARADTLRTLVRMTETAGCSTPSIQLFHHALRLSLAEHDKLVRRIIRARTLHKGGFVGHYSAPRLEFDNCSQVRLRNLVPLLNMLMDQEAKKTVGVTGVSTLTTSNEAGAENAASQEGVERGIPERLLDVQPAELQQDDTVYSLDLSAAADKMLLPSRDLYSGRLECLVLAPTLH